MAKFNKTLRLDRSDITMDIKVILPSWGIFGWRRRLGIVLIKLGKRVMGVGGKIEIEVKNP